MFRAKFLDGLAQAREQGRLPSAADDAAWRALLRALRRHDWVVYAKQPLGGPSQVLEYLARYTHRVTISNEQLADMADGTVAFRVRDNAHPGNKRIRHYGMLASVHKHAQLARCRQALQ
ncbi:MAG: transposase, partial [Bacillota bacterium]